MMLKEIWEFGTGGSGNRLSNGNYKQRTLFSNVFFCVPSLTDCISEDALGSK